MAKVLEELELADMHVHDIEPDLGHIPAPIALLCLFINTHYVMHGNDVVHAGTVDSIAHFALNLRNKEKS